MSSWGWKSWTFHRAKARRALPIGCSEGRGAVRFRGRVYDTLQPPLPLQLFLPLQPMSPELQPPCPLQLFIPLQSCLLLELLADAWPLSLEQPVILMTLPATNPAMAAEIINVLAVRFIALPSL
jgi:hypothetical protein